MNNNQYLNKISVIQMEISSLCNALCLGCVRTDMRNFSRTTPDLPKKTIMSLDTFESIITDSYFKNTVGNAVQFCGTVDDPLMHPQWLEILELCVKHKVDRIDVHTNAGIRSPEEWREMKKLLDKVQNRKDPDDFSVIRFNVDGLEDTNHIYRQRVKWNKIMENAKAFTENDGGKYARWQMIEFPWNRHQIDEARQLAYSMGFHSFTVRHDRSILKKDNITLDDVASLQKIYNEKRDDEPYIWDSKRVTSVYDNLAQYDQEISCYFQEEGMIFVDYNSRVWPCCFLRNLGFNNYSKNLAIMSKQRDTVMFEKYGDSDQTWNHADKHSLKEIMKHPFFANDLVESFDSTVPTQKDLETGNTCNQKLLKCSHTCGKKFRKNTPLVEAHKRTRLWKYYTDGRARKDMFMNSKI